MSGSADRLPARPGRRPSPPLVLQVVQSGDRGGVQRHLWDLVRGLPEHTAGVVVGSEGWLSAGLRRSGIPVVVVPQLTRSVWSALRSEAPQAVAVAVARTGATAVHAHGVVALRASLPLAARLPLLYTPHGLQWRDPALAPALRAGSWLLHARAAGRLAAVVAVCAADEREVRRVGVPASRVHRIPHGIALPQDGADPSAAGPRLGVAARLVAGKGLPDLLRAVAAIRGACLAVAGDGPLASALARQADRLGLRGRVQWCGWQEDLGPFYRSLRAYVTLSRKEGMPYALLEAMAHGLPVVASDIEGHREWVRPGVNGMLVSPNDPAAARRALRQLLESPASAKALGLAAREAVRRLPLPAMHAAYRQLYAAAGVPGAPLPAAGVERGEGGRGTR